MDLDIEYMNGLGRIMAENGLTRLEISKDGTAVALERGVCAAAPVSTSSPVMLPDAAPSDGAVDFNDLYEVKSPMVGVFYSAPSPDSPPFVTIGSVVKSGDVLCIIEAMKLLNEITAERDGEIVDICVKNGDIAEFGQVLFKMH